MSDVIEKIYCCDRNNNDNALAAAILANGNRNYDNEWMNNPFAYLMFLAFTRNGLFGDNNGNGVATQGIEMQAQLNAIRTQLQDNQNADCIKSAIQGNGYAISQLSQLLNIDFNTLQKCCCDVQSAIQDVAGKVGYSAERVINAANLGDCNIIQALKDCCCNTQKQLSDFRADVQLQNCKDTSELRSGQRDLGQAITQGFSQTAFQAQQDKCDIIRSSENNTQRIIDTLRQHWSDEKALENQDLKMQLSQRDQTDILTQRFLNANNYFNCGCNCMNGCGF